MKNESQTFQSLSATPKVGERTLPDWKLVLQAARPKTLPAALSPVLIGGALAYGSEQFSWLILLVIILTTTLIQILTNFVNDLHDFRKGADHSEREGPTRVVQAGLVSEKQMERIVYLTTALIILLGMILVLRGGVPILIIGLFSILGAYLYTAGPYPLAYLGLGDLFVLIFFGPVATAGTFFLCAGNWNETSIIAGLAPGLISTAILVVNNTRDAEGDRLAGKKTLAARFGVRFSKFEYILTLLLASAVPVLVSRESGVFQMAIVGLFFLCFSIPCFLSISHAKSADDYNKMLGRTSMLLVIYTLVFCVTWIIYV